MRTGPEMHRTYSYDGRLFKHTPPEQHWHIGKVSRGGRDLQYDSDGIEIGSVVAPEYRAWLHRQRGVE